MLKQAFGDSCMSRSRTLEWFGRFKNGRTSTANDDRSGRPSTATTPLKSGRGTGGCQPGLSSYHTRSLWNWLWILSANSHRTAEHASDCSEVCAESVDPGSDSRVALCQELKETVINDPTLLLNVITGDESIVYAYDPETKL